MIGLVSKANHLKRQMNVVQKKRKNTKDLRYRISLMKEIEIKRAQLKKQEYQRRKRYYADLEKKAISNAESKFKIDYQKKFDKARKRYETSFDKKTNQLIKNTERKETGKKVVKYKSKKKDIGWQDVKDIIQKYVRLRDSDQY